MAATRGTVTDATPRVAVRIDDGNLGAWTDGTIKAFLDLGIPVTLAINADTIGNAGQLTWPIIKEIEKYAQNRGTTMEIANHSANNWQEHGGSPELYTYAEMRTEVSNTTIAANSGQTPKVYVQPGDAAAAQFCQGNRETVVNALIDEGYDYAIGLALGDLAGGEGTFVYPSQANTQLLGNGTPGERVGLRPGQIKNPFMIPGAQISDLGNMMVTRGTPDGVDPINNAPDPDSATGEPGWLLGVDNNGSGVEGHKDNDWEKTFQFLVAGRLASGQSFNVALHGEVRTNALAIAAAQLSTGDGIAAIPGHFSAKVVAHRLKGLELTGNIVLVGLADWCQYIYSDYAAGTDLIANETCSVPLLDINDRSGGDVLCPRGMTNFPFEPGPFSNDNDFIENQDSEDSDNQYSTAATYIGKSVTGPRGVTGGIVLRPSDAAHTDVARVQFGGLVPGIYEFSCMVEGDTGEDLIIDDAGAVGTRSVPQTSEWFSDKANLPHGRFQRTHILHDESAINAFDLTTGEVPVLTMKFVLPKDPQPTLLLATAAQVNFAPTALGASDTQAFTWTDATDSGTAVVGARVVQIVPTNAVLRQTSGIRFGAEITGTGAANMTFYNYAQTDPYDPTLSHFRIIVEDLIMSSPTVAANPHPWFYNVFFELKAEDAEMKIGQPKFRYWPN